MPERIQRRLAAIVSADVVGYSRLMGIDEIGTLAALRAHRVELIDAKIAEHGGRIVKTMGDGLLLEFPSVVNATQCVIEVQQGMAERNEGIDEDRRITFRIGVNLGDIIIEEEDIFGDGVNVAARLQEIAEPGGVAISSRVHDDVRDRLEALFEDFGERKLKNIARPVRISRWSPPGISTSTRPKIVAEEWSSPSDKPSIAVLPFENMSGDPEQEYFSDGITEDIITVLSQIGWFFVIARNSTFTYKGQAVDLKRVGAELGVRYVVEGSVRKADNRVRVTAQLIDCDNGAHLWAERYDRDLEDIFTVQDEITSKVAGALMPEIFESEQVRALRLPSKDLSAQDLTWQGMWHYNQYTPESFARARDLLAAALEKNPNNASTLVARGFVESLSVSMGWHNSPLEACREAIDYANRALRLERNNSRAHLVMGVAFIQMRQWDQAFKACQTAVSLNPNYANGHFVLGNCELCAGNANAAVENIRKAMRLSPRDPFRFYYEDNLAVSFYRLRQYDKAAEWAESAIRKKSDFSFSHFDLAAALGQLGHRVEAEAALLRAYQVQPEPNLEFFQFGWPFKDPGDFEHFLNGLHKAGLPE